MRPGGLKVLTFGSSQLTKGLSAVTGWESELAERQGSAGCSVMKIGALHTGNGLAQSNQSLGTPRVSSTALWDFYCRGIEHREIGGRRLGPSLLSGRSNKKGARSCRDDSEVLCYLKECLLGHYRTRSSGCGGLRSLVSSRKVREKLPRGHSS